jgi:hypothetical protein
MFFIERSRVETDRNQGSKSCNDFIFGVRKREMQRNFGRQPYGRKVQFLQQGLVYVRF